MKNALLFILLTVTACCKQDVQGQTDKRGALAEARTSRAVSEKTTLQNALVLLLADSGFSGGVITMSQGCETPPLQLHIPEGMQLPQALDQLTAADNKHKWLVANDVIVVYPTDGIPSLLQTRIQEVQISNKSNLTLAVTELLQSRSIRDAATLLRVQLVSPEPGFQQLDRDQPTLRTQPLVLHDILLLDALNRVARANHNAIWSYDEYECGGRKRIRLDFVSR